MSIVSKKKLVELKREGFRKAVKNLYTQGFNFFLSRGYTIEEVNDFFAEPKVQAELARLHSEYAAYEEMMSKVRFITNRELATQAQEAVEVLRKSLRGPVYLYEVVDTKTGAKRIVTDQYGNTTVIEPEPTPSQLRAALELLKMLGIKPESNVLAHVEQVKPPSKIIDSTVIAKAKGGDGDEADKAISRERALAMVIKGVKKIEQKRTEAEEEA